MSDVDMEEFKSLLVMASKTIDDEKAMAAATEAPQPTRSFSIDGCNQWSFNGKVYAPCAETVKSLPAGAYRFVLTDRGLMVQKHNLVTDDVFEIPDAVNERVLTSIATFWESKDAFLKRGQLFKRGILLWGPAGSGKSSTIMLLARDIISRGGIVVINDEISYTIDGLALIRSIEAERPIVCILEDIEEIVEIHGMEKALLSLLDGEHQVGNICHIGTTNFPERLGARLAKRPSRFDEIIKVGMPTAAARKFYLDRKTFEGELTDDEKATWVADTEGFSFAFLRELIVAVFCLKRDYAETLKRLKSMEVEPQSFDEWRKERKIGMQPQPEGMVAGSSR